MCEENEVASCCAMQEVQITRKIVYANYMPEKGCAEVTFPAHGKDPLVQPKAWWQIDQRGGRCAPDTLSDAICSSLPSAC